MCSVVCSIVCGVVCACSTSISRAGVCSGFFTVQVIAISTTRDLHSVPSLLFLCCRRRRRRRLLLLAVVLVALALALAAALAAATAAAQRFVSIGTRKRNKRCFGSFSFATSGEGIFYPSPQIISGKYTTIVFSKLY